jgi:hypothetical protein
VASVKSLTAVLPVLALPAVVGEAVYLALQAVDLPIGNAELFRAVGAVVAGWATFFTGLTWRTFTMTRADHQLLHGVKGTPGLSERMERIERRVGDLPDDLERRFDLSVGRMVALGDKLETRIERLEDRHMGEEHR